MKTPARLEKKRPAAVIAAQKAIKRQLMLGVVGFVVLVCGAGGWAATTKFAGAVMAQGQLVVDSSVKKVQHPTGGVIGQLNVQEGDHVKAGDVLIRLDETVTKANLAIVSSAVDQTSARLARLEAERDGADKIDFPVSLTSRATDPEITKLMASETGLFDLRRKAREGQKAQLSERLTQLHDEIEGLTAQIAAKDSETSLIASEQDGVDKLYKQQLVPLARVTRLQRDAAGLLGERGQLVAAIAQTKGKISETQLQIIQIDQDFRSDVAKEMREMQAKLDEFQERKIAAEDQLRRIDLTAPQDGIVHQLNVHTIGGVINAGEPVMLIVPTDDRLRVEAKLPPTEVDKIYPGQVAFLRFTSFDQRTTPQVRGELLRISPDLTTDQRTGLSYYTLQIAMEPEDVAKLKQKRLIPGMPVEAFIQTNSRTVLSYLTKPLADQISKAFREN